MSIKLCSGVELKDIEKQTSPENECSLCEKVTPRMLKCHDYEKFGK